jgi:hypothetical protein
MRAIAGFAILLGQTSIGAFSFEMPNIEDQITITLEDLTAHSYEARRSPGSIGPNTRPNVRSEISPFPTPEDVKDILVKLRFGDDDSGSPLSGQRFRQLLSAAEAQSAAISQDYEYERDKEAARIENALAQGRQLVWENLVFTDEARHIIEMVFGAGGAAAFLKGCKDSLVAVLNYKAARRMTVTKGSLSITLQGSAATPDQMDKLIASIETKSTQSQTTSSAKAAEAKAHDTGKPSQNC